jgi:hypothetical protein
MDQTSEEWDKYAKLPSRLPPDLKRRHAEIYDKAIANARAKGWDPELGEDD